MRRRTRDTENVADLTTAADHTTAADLPTAKNKNFKQKGCVSC